MPRYPSSGDMANAVLVWCLDLQWGGRTYRTATEMVDLTMPDGSVVFYTDGMSEPDVVDEVSREGVHESDTVPLFVLLDGVDVAERVARGYRLEQARGELFAVYVDEQTGVPLQAHAERYRYLTGRLSRPVYADPSRTAGFLSFTLEDTPADDSVTLLNESAVINDTTHPSAPSEMAGKVYPVVIGTPGVFRKSDGTESTTSGSPAYPILTHGSPSHYEHLLIAGHEVVAETVTVFDADRASDTFTVQEAVDGLGRVYSYVDIHSGSIDRSSAEYWVCWNDGGGLPDPFAAGALSGVGSVCAWALLRSSREVDIPRWLIESGTLDRVAVATFINTPTLTPLSFVTRLLEPFGTEIRSGPDGLYPQPRLLNTPNAEGLRLLIEGPDLEPAGPLVTQTQLSDVINRCTIRFAPRARTGDYKRTLTVQADPDPDDPEVFSDEYAKISVNRWTASTAARREQSEVLELDWLYDEAGAGLIARERIQVNGLGYAERPYTAHRNFGWLRPGMQVRLQSESLHRTFLATVLLRRWSGTGWDIVFALDDDPIRASSLKKTGA